MSANCLIGAKKKETRKLNNFDRKIRKEYSID